jgi:chromosome partitioning protein
VSVYAVLNQKGGVGKTTLALNLAHTWATRGLTVLVVDVDKQGAASASLLEDDVTFDHYTLADVLRAADKIDSPVTLADAVQLADLEWAGIRVVPASLDLEDVWSTTKPGMIFRLRRALDESGASAAFDRVILDGPPDLGMGTVAAAVAADYVIIPTRPERMSMHGVARTVETVDVVRRDLRPDVRLVGVIPVAVDARVNEHAQRVAELGRVYGDLVTDTIVPHRLRSDEASGAGLPAALLDGPAGPAMASTYAALCDELDTRVGELLREQEGQ